MTLTTKKAPSYGRICKLFTNLGPYFRKQASMDSIFFFDCLEICLDSEKLPEEREFYGWWLLLEKEEHAFTYQRFDGLYDAQGDWVVESLDSQHKTQLDKSFSLFIKRLQTLIELETDLQFDPQPCLSVK